MGRRLLSVLGCVALLGACTSTGPDTSEGSQPVELGTDVAEDASAPRTVQPGAPGEPSRVLSAEEVAELDLAAPDLNEADIAFLQGMVVHHRQAVHMTGLVDDRRADPQLSLLAERMDISQRDEIDLMTRWLREADAEVPGGHGHGDAHHDGGHPGAGEDDHHDHDPDHGDRDVPMMGMLSDDELAALEDAEGEAFDELFLTGMIFHHTGALEMVEQLYRDGGGDNPDIARFADHVASDQHIEIARMRSMLVAEER